VLSGSSTLRISALGPVTAERGGQLLVLGGPKQRAVFVAMALQPGRTVSVEALLGAVWGEEPALRAGKTLQVYVANLRRVLETDRAPSDPPSVVVTRGPGYALEVEPGAVDAVRFERGVERGRRLVTSGDPVEAARALREALGEWCGAPLAGLEALPVHGTAAPRLIELRLDALEACIDAELSIGLSAAVIPELEDLVREAPYRERLRGLQIRALYAVGRQRDALAAYQQARQTLIDDLGIEPGPELRDLERRVLEQDGSLDIATSARVARSAPTDEAVIRKRVSIVAAVSAGDLDRRAVRTTVDAHGGTVIEIGQDSVVAAFGVPRLRADDVDRAARLGLALAEGGLSVAVATGVVATSGSVASGAPLSRALELAARARRGTTAVDRITRDLLGGRATVEPAADGASTLGALTAPAPTEPAGPFVGRDAELELLTAAWHAVGRSRRPAVVSLVGEPGLGTSRLALELASRVEAPLLRVELDPTVEPEALLAWLSTAPDGSIVLFEHLHRAIRAASWAVARWMEVESPQAVVCIATATSDLRTTAPGWPGAVPLAVTLDLPPLDQEATRRLAAHLLGDEVAGSRAATVAAIAGGNPLFLRELAQHVLTVEDGASLPDRLGALVAGRVEQMTPPARRLLEILAVVGAPTGLEPLDDQVEDRTGAVDDLVLLGLVQVSDDGELTVPEVVAEVVLTLITDERAVALHEQAASAASTLTARALHLEYAASRSVSGADTSAASAAVDALAELAWRTWSRGDIESAVDAVHRAIAVAEGVPIDVIDSVRAARRRLATEVVAGRMGTPHVGQPSRASVGAWDAGRRVERELVEAATALAATTPHTLLRDQCHDIVKALSREEAGDERGSASSPT
jgi:DNA-binding SARP family transcriptional activator